MICKNRKFYPNVIKKRVWSYALNDWVRFNMTTTALKAIDDYGGIDNYIMSLDERSVQDSNYIIKMRGIIGAALFQRGELSDRMTKRLGFDLCPPTAEFTCLDDSHFDIKKKKKTKKNICFIKKPNFKSKNAENVLQKVSTVIADQKS